LLPGLMLTALLWRNSESLALYNAYILTLHVQDG